MRHFELPGRSPVHSTTGMAATSQPLATLTAINVLQGGGNAMDAAVAACAVQCVIDGVICGYIPKAQAVRIAEDLDNGQELAAKVAEYSKIYIEIFEEGDDGPGVDGT